MISKVSYILKSLIVLTDHSLPVELYFFPFYFANMICSTYIMIMSFVIIISDIFI